MGCVQSVSKNQSEVVIVKRDVCIQTEKKQHLDVIIDYEETSEASTDRRGDSYNIGYDDIDASTARIGIQETIDELNNSPPSSHPSLSNHPSSQSPDMTNEPINVIAPFSDEEKTINSFITSAVDYRNGHGGRCNLDKQLKRRRLELICVGAFIQSNNARNKYEILSYDRTIQMDDKKYRPDLILRDNDTKMIVHVEIDEFAHSAYNNQEEILREKVIAHYFRHHNYQRIRFNPNAYTSKVEMALSFTRLLFANDGVISVCFNKAEKHEIKK